MIATETRERVLEADTLVAHCMLCTVYAAHAQAGARMRLLRYRLLAPSLLALLIGFSIFAHVIARSLKHFASHVLCHRPRGRLNSHLYLGADAGAIERKS